jgi:hypothetical protein
MAGLLYGLVGYVDRRERELGPLCILDPAHRVITLPRLNIQMSFNAVAAIGIASGASPMSHGDSFCVTQVILITRDQPAKTYVITVSPRGAGGPTAIASIIAATIGVEVRQCQLNHDWISQETVH